VQDCARWRSGRTRRGLFYDLVDSPFRSGFSKGFGGGGGDFPRHVARPTSSLDSEIFRLHILFVAQNRATDLLSGKDAENPGGSGGHPSDLATRVRIAPLAI
jgi:hypothetical protein